MNRYLSIDVLRGVIMIIMAIDHTIGSFADPHAPEIALGASFVFPGYSSITSQWSRLITHLCAPGFQLLAGMGLALSVARSSEQGVSQWAITRDLATRGIVLILMDLAVMGYIYQSPFLFLVLCCIGSCTLCFTVLRFLPKHLIGLVGVAIIGLAPWYAPEAVIRDNTVGNYLKYMWTGIVLAKDGDPNIWYQIMYPILPWLGIFAIGWWIGLVLREADDDSKLVTQMDFLVIGGFIITVAALVLRATGHAYFERMPLGASTFFDRPFWQFAKYPPSLVFMMLTVGILIMMLGLLRPIDCLPRAPLWAKFVSVYGRTALFYFVVHFYILFFSSWYCGFEPGKFYPHRYSFTTAYQIWMGLVLGLWPVCWVYDKMRQRFRVVLRYF